MQLRKLFEEERTRQQPSSPVSATSATATTTSSHEQSLFDLYNDVDDSTTASLEDELSIFLAEPPVSLPKDQHGKQLPFNPIYWWRDNESRFPILAQLAMDHFACPAMSTECERSFSIGGQVLNEHRPRTLDDLAQAQQCLRSWISNDLVDLYTILSRVQSSKTNQSSTSDQSSNQAPPG